jgi:hypothetical protein
MSARNTTSRAILFCTAFMGAADDLGQSSVHQGRVDAGGLDGELIRRIGRVDV